MCNPARLPAFLRLHCVHPLIEATGRFACTGGVGLRLLAMLLLPTAVSAAGPLRAAHAQRAPIYRFSVHLDTRAHSIAGVMKLELDAADTRLGQALWFHLPPNRFREPDTRGRRRNTDSLPFATNFTDTRRFDPMWPAGFSEGGIDIQAVEDAGGRALPFAFAENPLIPQGFATRDGLMRVDTSAAQGGLQIVIRFRTRLPNRFWEGWSQRGYLLEQWHPVLADHNDGQWVRDIFSPRAGRYQAGVSVDRQGRLFLGRRHAVVAPERPFQLPLAADPMRSLPLVFLELQEVQAVHDYDLSLYAFFSPGNGRLGRVQLEAANKFLAFMRRKYRLALPDTQITMIEVDLPPGDMRTMGSMVLIPKVYYRNSALMDRVFLAQLARALAQIWFGEVVWSNRDRQSWLHLGLAGYMALDFFHSLYGKDAGIHTIMDWLRPRYREHFFEVPVRDLMRNDEDAPLMISLTGHPLQRTAMLVAHNKAPLVIRSLHYLVGDHAFSLAINTLYRRYRYREVDERTFSRALSEHTDRDVEGFFRHWFHGAPQVDFAIEDWEQEPVPGGYTVRVQVRRSALSPLPVDVRVVAESGATHAVRWVNEEAQSVLTFHLTEPAAEIVIDPEEYWLELDRKNNYTETLYRVRPIFDWPKQREVLVALRGVAGGNSIDGNYLGLGVNLYLNENNTLLLTPIYGQRTGLTNYQASWRWRQFLIPKLNLQLTLQKLRGTTLQGLGFQYDLLNTDDVLISPAIEFRYETVGAAGFTDRNGQSIAQPAGPANNVAFNFILTKKPGRFYGNSVELEFINSRRSYNSDFDFTSHRIDFAQTVTLGSSHQITLALTRGGVEGSPPLQKRHELGGPALLRGYPRILELANEEIAAGKLDYGIVFSRETYGSAAQIRRITAFLFADVGRGWNNDETHRDRPQRQDVGVGVEVSINLLRLVEFPIRVDVAVPINDPEFEDPQFILFGVLNF